MSPDADEEFVDRLAALDEALAEGQTPPDFGGEPALQQRLKRGLAALQALRHGRPEAARPTLHDHNAPTLSDARPGPAPLHFGRFHIIRELGRGGFGIVFLARDPKLHRDVALKVPHAQSVMDSGMRERFRREAQAAAGLGHPNIVTVFEVDEQGPICALVSAFCPSVTLTEWLARRKSAVDPKLAARIVADLAEAVAYAHTKGVLHRDLKPANVLVAGDGDAVVPKITDFGLAKFADDTSRVTRSGAVIGTPAYMAPEQARGKNDAVDARSDVYALGAILYEILTGRPPFCGESDVETLQLVCETEPIAPRNLRPRLPRDLETICLKCLDKEPTRRYESAAALHDDLQRFIAGEPVRARPIGPTARAWRWCRRHPAVSALSTALLVAVTAGSAGMWRAYGQVIQERQSAVGERDRNGRLFTEARGTIQELIDQGHNLVHDPSTVRQGLEALEVGRRSYTNLLRENPNDQPMRQQAVLICKRLGMVYSERREFGAGDKAWTEAIEHAEILLNGPEGEKHLAEYFDLIAKWSEILMYNRRVDELFAMSEPALVRARAICAAKPDDADAAWNLHGAIFFRGIAAKNANRWDAADAALREGLAAIQRCRDGIGPPRNVTVEANYLNALSDVAVKHVRLPDAVRWAGDATAVARQALAQNPGNLDLSRALAGSLNRLGRANYVSRNWQATVDAFREANQLFISNWQLERHTFGAYFNVALGTKLISDSLDKLERREEALPDLKTLIELSPPDFLAGRNDPNPPDLYECYARLAALHLLRGEWDDARRVHAEAVKKLAAVPNKTEAFGKAETWLNSVGEKLNQPPTTEAQRHREDK